MPFLLFPHKAQGSWGWAGRKIVELEPMYDYNETVFSGQKNAVAHKNL